MENEKKILDLIIEDLDPSFVDTVLANTEIEDLNIFDDLGYDSLNFIELVIKLESAFQVNFDESSLFMDNFGELREIVRAVESLINSKNDGGQNDRS